MLCDKISVLRLREHIDRSVTGDLHIWIGANDRYFVADFLEVHFGVLNDCDVTMSHPQRR